jgi:hypothetical protein
MSSSATEEGGLSTDVDIVVLNGIAGKLMTVDKALKALQEEFHCINEPGLAGMVGAMGTVSDAISRKVAYYYKNAMAIQQMTYASAKPQVAETDGETKMVIEFQRNMMKGSNEVSDDDPEMLEAIRLSLDKPSAEQIEESP